MAGTERELSFLLKRCYVGMLTNCVYYVIMRTSALFAGKHNFG